MLAAVAIVAALSGGSTYGYRLPTSLFIFAAFLAVAVTLVATAGGGTLLELVDCPVHPGKLVLIGFWTGTVAPAVAAWWIAVALKK